MELIVIIPLMALMFIIGAICSRISNKRDSSLTSVLVSSIVGFVADAVRFLADGRLTPTEVLELIGRGQSILQCLTGSKTPYLKNDGE